MTKKIELVKERFMTFIDPIGDMLTRIRNGQMRSLNKIDIPFSNFRLKILEVLKKEGYIIDFKIDIEKKNIIHMGRSKIL